MDHYEVDSGGHCWAQEGDGGDEAGVGSVDCWRSVIAAECSASVSTAWREDNGRGEDYL